MIYWVHDYRVEQWLGGAQLTSAYMISKSPAPIKSIFPDNFDRNELDGNLIILNNTGLFKLSDLEWIVDTQKYIKYEHDYAFCKHRHSAEHDCSIECKDTLKFYTKMFNNSILNIFLSPAHMNVYLKYMDLDMNKIHLQPSPINVDRFSYSGDKEDLYIAAGEDAWHKGSDLIKEEFKNKNFKFLKGIPYDEIDSWFKRAKYFVHKPRWVEPFGRTVAEAYCANCELILNDKIGFMSYDWDYSNYDFVTGKLREAPNVFWDKVLNV